MRRTWFYFVPLLSVVACASEDYRANQRQTTREFAANMGITYYECNRAEWSTCNGVLAGRPVVFQCTEYQCWWVLQP